MGDEIFESGYTNSEGYVRLPITSSEEGEVLVTVTKRNHYPYQSSFQLYDPGVSINLSESAFTVDDDTDGQSNGDNNSLVSGGETIELLVNATNYGSEDAYGITGTIISENDGVIIETSQVNFGDIANGMTVAAEQPFVFSVVNGLEEGHDLKLMINFTDNNDHSFNGWLDLNVSGNLLIASEIDVLASNQNLLTPGQSSFVKISLENMGSANSNSIIGTITCISFYRYH